MEPWAALLVYILGLNALDFVFFPMSLTETGLERAL